MRDTRKELEPKPEDGEEDSKLNVVPIKPSLRVISGGGGGPWLWSLPIGTVFLSRGRKSTDVPFVQQYQIANKSVKAVLLYSNLMEEIIIWVDPVIFSNQMELVEILGEEQDGEDQ
jgi:hypothetical protein